MVFFVVFIKFYQNMQENVKMILKNDWNYDSEKRENACMTI